MNTDLTKKLKELLKLEREPVTIKCSPKEPKGIQKEGENPDPVPNWKSHEWSNILLNCGRKVSGRSCNNMNIKERR